MLKQKTKDIEVGGKRYRLNKLDARAGSYVAAKIALFAAPALKNGHLTEDAMASLVTSLNRRDFDELQTILLKTVYKLNQVNGEEIPEALIRANGDFVDDDLAYDIASVINITVQSAMFNIGDFFSAAGLMKVPAV